MHQQSAQSPINHSPSLFPSLPPPHPPSFAKTHHIQYHTLLLLHQLPHSLLHPLSILMRPHLCRQPPPNPLHRIIAPMPISWGTITYLKQRLQHLFLLLLLLQYYQLDSTTLETASFDEWGAGERAGGLEEGVVEAGFGCEGHLKGLGALLLVCFGLGGGR